MNKQQIMDGGPLLRAHVAHRIAYHITRETHMMQAKLDEFFRVTRSARLGFTPLIFCDQCNIPYDIRNENIVLTRCSTTHHAGDNGCGKLLSCGRPWCVSARMCATCGVAICEWDDEYHVCNYCDADVCFECMGKWTECCEGRACNKCRPPPGTKKCEVCDICDAMLQEQHVQRNHGTMDYMDCKTCCHDDCDPAMKQAMRIVKKRRRINA